MELPLGYGLGEHGFAAHSRVGILCRKDHKAFRIVPMDMLSALKTLEWENCPYLPIRMKCDCGGGSGG